MSPGSMRETEPPTPAEKQEIESIRTHLMPGGSLREAFALMDAQLNTLHLRASAVLTVCGVVITVTGFSGRIIAGTSLAAQVLVISGLALCALAAATTILFVLPIRWLTSYMHLGVEEWLLTAIRRRNRKTVAFRIANLLLILGVALYGVSIAMMLLRPN